MGLDFSISENALIFAPAFEPEASESLVIDQAARMQRRFFGKMAEWSIAAVLKTVDLKGSGGSNPSLSARAETSV